ncbi:MAG: HAD family hydrolase [Egibacteraceae bacterium]
MSAQGEALSVQAVALDVDGTLAGADHKVSPRAVAVLSALERAGIRVVIVTGRTVGATRKVVSQAGLQTPFIACTGAVIEDPVTGERLREQALDPEVVARTLEVAAARGLSAVLWTPEAMYAEERTPSVELLEELNDERVRLGALGPVAERPVVKIIIAAEPERLDVAAEELRDELPELVRSMDTFLETAIEGDGKAGALRLVLDRLGIPPEACAGAGDSDTDAEWLEMVGLPVAVANARPSVQAVSDRIIGHHADDAVAAFLEGLLAHRLEELGGATT